MTIKAKSYLLISLFSVMLLLNAFTIFYSISHIKDSNEHLIKETNTIQTLKDVKFLVKELQELSTDITLMGDKEGLKEIDEIIEKFNIQISSLIKMKNHKEFQTNLNEIKTIFEPYSKALKEMAENGIVSVEERNKLIQILSSSDNFEFNSKLKSDFQSFVKAVFDVENVMIDKVDKYSEEINSLVEKISTNQEKYFKISVEKDLETIDTFQTVSIIVTLLFAVTVIILFIIIGNILKNIQKLDYGVANLVDTSTEASTVDIDSNDELGNVAKNFNEYIQTINNNLEIDLKAIDNAKNVIQKVETGLFNDRISTHASSLVVEELILSINNMINTTQTNLRELSLYLSTISRGDFNATLPEVSITGILGSIFSGSKLIQTSINEVIAIIDNSTKRLIYSADDLSQNSHDLSDSANAQAAALEQTAAAIEEVTSTIRSGNENTAKMLDYASKVTHSSDTGIDLAEQTSQSMEQLSLEVNTINEAIIVIDQIAFQTNILSLNAAVEAATAGEAGKGFAVVAAEVRSLASRSAEAANEIKRLVESATQKANHGKEVSTKMINGFHELKGNITSTISVINEVANSIKEQELAMVQINDTVNALDQATQKNASLASDISVMAANTKELAEQLKSAVDANNFDDVAKRRVCDPVFAFTINSLKTDHVAFKNNAFASCEHGKKFTVTKHTECKFGKWILEMEAKNDEVTHSETWKNLVMSHKRVHMMTQDSVDLYADGYTNGQIFSVTQNLEKEMKKVFNLMDKVKEVHCDKLFRQSKRG